VQLKLRFVTDFLGAPVARAALSPRLLFACSVRSRIGPRFAFVKARGAAAGLAPATLLKSTDEVIHMYLACSCTMQHSTAVPGRLLCTHVRAIMFTRWRPAWSWTSMIWPCIMSIWQVTQTRRHCIWVT